MFTWSLSIPFSLYQRFLSCPHSWYIIHIFFFTIKWLEFSSSKKCYVYWMIFNLCFSFLFFVRSFYVLTCLAIFSSILPSKGEDTLSTWKWVLLLFISHFHKYNNNLMHVVLNKMFNFCFCEMISKANTFDAYDWYLWVYLFK